MITLLENESVTITDLQARYDELLADTGLRFDRYGAEPL